MPYHPGDPMVKLAGLCNATGTRKARLHETVSGTGSARKRSLTPLKKHRYGP